MNPAHNFLTLSAQRRGLVFEQASVTRAIDPIIVEKEFWVCWLLGVLFAIPELAPHVVFKGGTSLSKVFGVIDRFSEDVDLSVSPAFVGADPHLLDEGVSRTRRDKAMAEMQRLCGDKAEKVIAPLLEAALQGILGAPAGGGQWLSYELDTQAHSPNLYFHYPTTTSTDLAYVRRAVKLELGSLTDQQPTGRHPVKPWVAEDYPAIFNDWRCEVTALELGRASGRRRRFCIPSSIALRNSHFPTVMRGTTPTSHVCLPIGMRKPLWGTRRSPPVWSNGRADSFRGAGPITIWRGTAVSGSCRRLRGTPNWSGITRSCVPCFCMSRRLLRK